MRCLKKRWQLFLYGLSGMGVNMLNLIVGSYLCDAIMVEGFDANVESWTYLNITLVSVALWSVLKTVAKIVDGVIDIPLANLTDNLKSRWGRRRPPIAVGFVLMLVFYVAFLFPLTNSANSVLNTVWFGVMLCLFYTFYSLVMTTYYATFSEIVEKDEDRVVLSNFKTVFDIVYFILGYALIPLFVGLNINIRIIGFAFMPLSLTMLIPLFMIKEKSTLVKDKLSEQAPAPAAAQAEIAANAETINAADTAQAEIAANAETINDAAAAAQTELNAETSVGEATATQTESMQADSTNEPPPADTGGPPTAPPPVKETTPGLIKSFVLTVTNKPFAIWMAVYAFLQFGVQMFLAGQNVLFSGTMGFDGIYITVVMACAFVPVPLFLILYNKLVGKYGIKFGYVFSLAAYCVAMGIMAICSESIIPNVALRLVVACIGAVVSSIGTGSFFSVGYTVPSTIANLERLKTGVSHSAMYFAVQGLISGVATAISTGVVWVNLRGAAGGAYLWLTPIIVIAACLISLVLTHFLPDEIKYSCKKQAATIKK